MSILRLLYVGSLLLLSSLSVCGQRVVQGQITDATTAKPVPYVNVGIRRLATGTVSDSEGIYQLTFHDPADVVTFSSVGYREVTMTAGALLKNGNVQLREKQYRMPTVVVTAEMLDGPEVILGSRQEKKGHSVGFGSRQLGTEIGALIDIETETYIQKAHFALNHAKGDSLLFRVHLYEVIGGAIGEDLLTESVFVATRQRSGEFTVDLSAFDLLTDREVLLALEWIRDDGGSGNSDITFRARKSKRLDNLYTKETSLVDFRKLSSTFPGAPGFQLGFYLTGRRVKK